MATAGAAEMEAELANFLSISRAFKLSKALGVACKLNLFTLLSQHPPGLSCPDISARLGWCASPGFRGSYDFLDLLVAGGCLQRAGPPLSPAALYANTPAGARYLVQGSPDYMAGIAVLNNDRSYILFEHLEEAMVHGCVPQRAYERVPDIHTVFGTAGGGGEGGGGAAAAQHFALGMLGASLGNFRKLAAAFDFSRYRSLADFGGSTGCLCVCVAQAHPHVACTTYDLPPVHAVAEAYVRDQGAQAAVAVRDWDFFSEQPFPSGHDVVAFGMVLHDWGEARKRQLVRKAYEALPPGGVLIAVDNLIDDDRRRCVTGLGMSLDMLLEFGAEASFDYSFAEFTAWATAAGFARTECLPLVGDAKAAVAYK